MFNHTRTSSRRVGFVSTRLAGTDGVSLETAKWAQVLEGMGHECFFFAGQIDTPPERSRCVPEAFFGHPDVEAIQSVVFGRQARPPAITARIKELTQYLKSQIDAFVCDYDIDLLIPQNALTIPMHLPLGLALTELIAETNIPTISHNHDFFWERQRFLVSCVGDYLAAAFPAALPSIRHVVINSLGAQQLSLRTGMNSVLVPNVMDFDNPPPAPDAYLDSLRADLGVQPGELLVLQPTRVVQRKGIEHAIELVRRLGIPARLVISHASGDEGDDYERRVRDYAALMNVPTTFVSDIIQQQRGFTADGRKAYTLEDAYQVADLVTYPSLIEGFGNALLEAMYFRKPVVVNRYAIYDVDIRPKGFQTIEFDSYITDATVRQVHHVLQNPDEAKRMADLNYELCRRHYSLTVLERLLGGIMADLPDALPATLEVAPQRVETVTV